MWSGRLGQVQSTNHRIDLIPGKKPVHCQPYRAGPRARAVESAEIQRMLKAEVIEPATSEWASPIVLVAKPDGSARLCVDYRKLNAITVRDSYPLPRMDECIDSLGDAKRFYDHRLQLWLLADPRTTRRPGEDHIYFTRRSILVSANALWPTQRARYLPTLC
jgi:hypothetical protein